MKYRYVFLLGRPGCGKSVVYRYLEQHIPESGQPRTCERVDDFQRLWAKFQEDNALEQERKERLYTRRAGRAGFRITHDDVWGVILREVNDKVLEIDRSDHTIFVEFARARNVEALQSFDKRILGEALVIYLEVNFDTCWARNVARYEAAMADSGDDHWVPRREMEALYRHDDRDALAQFLQDQNIPFIVVNNEADGEEHLRTQVEDLFQSLS